MSKKAREHLGQDAAFREIIETTRLPRATTDGDVYAALIRTIVYQQLSGKAAATIHKRLLDLFDDGYPHVQSLLRLSIQQLRDAGLSRQKSSYLHNVADYWAEQQLDKQAWKRLTDQQVISLLTPIKGVGKWSAEMILMFTLKRPDVFPVNDLGIRNAIVKRYRLRSKGKQLDRRLTQIAEQWRPHRTLACRYLWKWLDGSS